MQQFRCRNKTLTPTDSSDSFWVCIVWCSSHRIVGSQVAYFSPQTKYFVGISDLNIEQYTESLAICKLTAVYQTSED